MSAAYAVERTRLACHLPRPRGKPFCVFNPFERCSVFDVDRYLEGQLTARYALYRRRFLCRCAFMRLRRLCFAIFALRLFLREPIQFFCSRESRFNHLMRRVATYFFCCDIEGFLRLGSC